MTTDAKLKKCTHLGVGAHQDDLEVMAGHGILECQTDSGNEFVGVTCTNGAGSARDGEFLNFSDEQMADTRFKEQELSASLGNYLSMFQLGFSSASIKEGMNSELIDELKKIIVSTEPEIIYTHNPVDKHLTHIRVFLHLLTALRETGYRPQQFLGCEVWRNLDWLPDDKKVLLPISDSAFIEKLIACHRSQTAGGKRYDLATVGRMKANATFFESHHVDQVENQIFAMDLMPLLENPKLDPKDFILMHLDDFKKDVFKLYE